MGISHRLNIIIYEFTVWYIYIYMLFAPVQLKQPGLLLEKKLVRSEISTEAKHSCRQVHWFHFCFRSISISLDFTTWRHVKTIPNHQCFCRTKEKKPWNTVTFQWPSFRKWPCRNPKWCDRMTTHRKWSNNIKYLSIHHACPQQHYAQSIVRADGALDDKTTGARSVHSNGHGHTMELQHG